jgi:dTDP-4-dehydrorhamnose reductase
MIKNQSKNQDRDVELWAGLEATVNRVGDQYFDQTIRNGHETRIQDLDLLADLGIRTLRYPVLWERTAPNGIGKANWTWADERLGRLRELGIQPIAGLVHHGSGPLHTSLIDPNFAPGLAEYARAVAERYPWVNLYTPVNEPLTTARFSGLYGHWYPHGRDELSFVQCLLNQCRAVVLSMRAIREVNPNAQLVQTEDLGKTHSTPALAYQAEFENERRWVSFDLLCGRIVPEHRMWRELIAWGATQSDLEWFLENRCPPDIMGINHYLTSERFLDEYTHLYPEHTHGGNGRHTYADVEAVRVCTECAEGPEALLRETWERYGLPLAVTEAHLHCTREEQMRWLDQVWNAAKNLRADGIDMRAVTVWSVLGAYDWNSLLTRNENHYEPGAFDLRGPKPRTTAIATMMRALATTGHYEHPVLNAPGWWVHAKRLLYPSVSRLHSAMSNNQSASQTASSPRRPILVTGATGTLGKAFARLCEHRELDYVVLTRQQMDIADADSVRRALEEFNPWAVVNTAGYVRVDDAEREADACFRENTQGAVNLATTCAAREIPFLTYSSDLVFDGSKGAPYVESDAVHPLNVYGQSKAEAELKVLEAYPGALVARTSAFFGPWDQYNFVTVVLRVLRDEGHFVAMDDAVISPTYVPDLVQTSLDLLIDGERGIWHLANPGSITWADLARRVAERAGLDASQVEGRATASFNLPAPRPLYSVLGSERGTVMRPLNEALEAYFSDCETARVAPASLWQRKVAVESLNPWNRAELLSRHLSQD